MTTLLCPLCSQSRFDTLESLRVRLVTAATQNITCPICSESLMGLDKYTIHLFGHTLTAIRQESSPPPVAPIISIKPDVLEESLCTVNMDDLGFLTSWDTRAKNQKSATITEDCKRFDFLEQQENQVYDSYHADKVLEQKFSQKDAVSQVEPCDIDADDDVSLHTPISFEAHHVRPAKNTKSQECQVFQAESTSAKPSSRKETCSMPPVLFLESPEAAPNIGFFSAQNYQQKPFCDEEPPGKPIFDPLDTSNSLSPKMPAENFSENKELSEYMSDLLEEKLFSAKQSFPNLGNSLQCDMCDCAVGSVQELLNHKEVAHGNQQKSADAYSCGACGRGFRMRGSLLVHSRVAHAGLGADCLGDVAADQEPRNFHCTNCVKSFKKEQHLMQHMKTHDGKQWQCETCSKYFTTKYFLKKHQRLHTGEMPYSCDLCKKTFTFQQSYHKHLLYHSADKPHECQECGRAFKELSTLHNHQRIHSGEKPFACETCGKCFRQRVSYIVHQRIHTGVLPYQCTACKKKFRYKVSQRSHKCAAQPPGIVVRQPGDLIQRILEQRQNILQCLE